MLQDKEESKYRVCNESNPNYKIFNPQTEPFQKWAELSVESKLLCMFSC